ncbi:acyl-CoA carboxylase subunit beta [Oceanicoccus sagamiensis]|uniref:Biotin carboxylase n=1 Tax=Oceanicoccus sagamiensis TaxID=716816 RepID=A0A1X9NDE6_9GAMM|nr:carboxyl transferase domain-containing protein [Oceanicoccus sagamiensis]ARN75181.1 biotin carboxylase [Oceanicoccus sagamiensis]
MTNNNKPDDRTETQQLRQRLLHTLDEGRPEAAAKRHKKGYRTARENLNDLCDVDSFVEYGQLAVAAQRGRIGKEELQTSTAADGVITGTATINSELHPDNCSAAVVVNDYSVLAGSQGYFHHLKLDRILTVAKEQQLPVVMFTEGGGGRPGDTDVNTQIAGLNILSFALWAELSGIAPRIAVNNGYCFAGNAALFGCADITIATETSWIGMAGPAMIEGGGLGSFKPTEIGPIDVQSKNGVVDIVVKDEAEATVMAKNVLSIFQGKLSEWSCADQNTLQQFLPEDRRYAYPVRKIIHTLADTDSFIELRATDGRGIVTGFIRIEGRPIGLIANDCKVLGGAIDSDASEKAARFIQLCNSYAIPLVSLCDTPGFMVGPDNEEAAAVRRMSRFFVAGAAIDVPLVTIFLRKGYGLGAMAMAGGSFAKPCYSASWPTGEFGGMGLEGAVNLGFKKELEAESDPQAKKALFDTLVEQLYDRGKATEAASFLEIDAVIDPQDSRKVIINAIQAASKKMQQASTRRFVDTW